MGAAWPAIRPVACRLHSLAAGGTRTLGAHALAQGSRPRAGAAMESAALNVAGAFLALCQVTVRESSTQVHTGRGTRCGPQAKLTVHWHLATRASQQVHLGQHTHPCACVRH